MGNIVKKLSSCCGVEAAGEDGRQQQHRTQVLEAQGFAALATDLLRFETLGLVPEGLSNYVTTKKKTQAAWYRKLLDAWKAEPRPPSNAHEAAKFVVQTLHGHRKVDVQGILLFYNLPQAVIAEIVPSTCINSHIPIAPDSHPLSPSGSWPKGVLYELQTLQVDAKSVVDGDTLIVYVDVNADAREKKMVPKEVLQDAAKRQAARNLRDYVTADALAKAMKQAGYKIMDSKDGAGIIAHSYRVRLRGVDAPESSMPYGLESREALLSLVEKQCLHLLVYGTDQYGRIVADVYSNKCFIQEVLLKRGVAWHYAAYDHRPEFAKWEQQAREARVGLWEASNPQKPWEYRKKQKM